MKLPLSLLVLAAIAAIPGCHSNSSASAPAQPSPAATQVAAAPIADPCKLVTVDEVSQVMGRKSNPGELRDAFHGKRCNFYDPTSQYEIFLQTVDWGLAGPMMTPDNTLSGIGEKAFWMDGSIYVLKNGNGMMVGFQLPHVMQKMTPDAEKFGKLVASRM